MKKQTILTALYPAVWILSLLVFWIFMSPSDAIIYVLIFLYALIPLTTLVVSFLQSHLPELMSQVRNCLRCSFGDCRMFCER